MLAPATVKASLKHGTLKYRADQPVKLIERGRGINRVLGTVNGKGLMRFTPAAGRGGTPDEVGTVGALLMGADGGFITGSDILMDCGVTASYFYGELARST